jgi:hypothetical protein
MLRLLVMMLNIIGFLLLFVAAACGLHVAVGIIASLLGICACFGAVAIKSRRLLASSMMLAIGIVLAVALAFYLEGLGMVRLTPVGEKVVAPDHMEAIVYQGEVYRLIQPGATTYLFISNEASDDSDLIRAIDNVLTGQDAFGPVSNYTHSQPYSVGYMPVYFYDMEMMPEEEASDVAYLLGIYQTPCLVKVVDSRVVDCVTEADEADIRDLFGY